MSVSSVYLDVLAEVPNGRGACVAEVCVDPPQEQLLRGDGQQVVQILSLAQETNQSYPDTHVHAHAHIHTDIHKYTI